ncbi:MAG TPA: prolyl oligopeptidase family serine peptidase [Asticcacaulis sp.]|nr:prolyl oligopeptidase family serine peptidase [Asticcacaulis sp.]
MPCRFRFFPALATLLLAAAPLSVQAQMTTIAKPAASNPNTAAPGTADPRAFLDDIDGKAALDWVKAHNEASLARLSKDPRFAQNQADMLKILQASDRIPTPGFAKHNKIDNFWQDAEHSQGIWRRTTWESYQGNDPKWETLLDIDALSKAEGRTWVYHSTDCLPPAERFCLVSLADGGTDAEVIREFDTETKSFVKGGFDLPAGKQSATWLDKDTLYVSREWIPGEVTSSGYPYVTKRLKRGETLDQAVEIFRGKSDDVSADRGVLRDIDGKYVIDMATRSPSFFETITTFFTDSGPVTLPLPLTSEFDAYYKGQAIYLLKEDWTSAQGTTFKSGALVAFDLKKALAEPRLLEPTVIFQPSEHQSVDGVTQTKHRLILSVLSNVAGEVLSFDFDGKTWTSRALKLPANSTLAVNSADDESDHLFVSAAGFLAPSTLFRADSVSGKVEMIKAAPERFNADGLQVQQFWVASKDGTQVPYFLVARKDVKLDGNTPTLLYAYGGFEVSMLPNYSAAIGKLWLEKGGAYVLANIRGGGEFGPKWHEAGLKTNRQRIYDDFQAVAQDLIDRKLTSPRRLGIMGGSNGGLLMGVQLTQRPDLWNAVVVQVPLLDMVNFTHMSAGASWQGEYGNPNDPVQGAFLRSISPYHNVKAGTAYPEPLFETSTKDDRVGPVHARKMAALFEDMGLPFYYYENTEGGHSAAANLAETARRYAIEYTYLAQKLMD